VSIFSRRAKPNIYPVAGRYPDVDINIYGKNINGRIIIDYDKLRQDDPALYEKVIKNERESFLRDPYDVDAQN
jgi:hypothetical protein